MSINDVKSLLQPVIHDSPKLKSDSESSLFDLGSPIKKQMSELVPPASPTLNSEQLSESPPTKMAKRKNFDFGGLGDSEDNMILAKRRRFQWYVFIHLVFCYQNSTDLLTYSKFLQILGLQPRNSKSFSRSREQVVLTVKGQNNC